jgi:phosphoglycolate phosphatase
MLAIFDLDGTLVDSRRDLTDASNDMLGSFGAAPLAEEQVVAMVGEGAATLVARLLAARELDVAPNEALARFLDAYDRRLLNHTRPYEGIPLVLDELSAFASLAVLTNKPSAATIRVLEGLDLHRRFSAVIGGDSPYGRKPAPAGVHALIASAADRQERTVLVGDSAIDVRTARAAGVHVCVARYGFGFSAMPADLLDGTELVVDRPADLTSVLAAFRS